MRRRKWVVGGMAGALALFCAAGGAAGQTGGDKAVAVVNGEAIGQRELDALLKQDGPMAVALPEAVRKQHLQIALDALINERLLRQFLKQSAPPVDAKELHVRMSALAAGLQQEHKSLAEFCRDLNQTEEQVRATVVAKIQWNAYAQTNIHDQQVEQFYQDNKDFFDKIRVRASEIMLSAPAAAAPADRERAKSQMVEWRRKILANEIDFAQTAKQYSQGPTKDAGGDLDWFPHLKGILPECVLQAAFSLKPGEMSEVLESEYGFHLIKVAGREPGEPSDFGKMKGEVRQMCIEEMQQVILRQLREEAQKTGQIKILLK